MTDFLHIPYVQAKWFTPVDQPPRHIDFIVLHSMEAPEKGETAEATARYFASGAEGRKASAHYCIDSNSIVQCVQTKDVAYGAPGVNHNGIHLELAGYAKQTREAWLDLYSKATISLAAELCAKILMPKYSIPAQYADAMKLKAGGHRGITTHAQVSAAFNPGGHWDPGPAFPMDVFLAAVQFHMRK